VSKAREQVAAFIGCDPAELYFTSGATESNNIALLGVAAQCEHRKKIVTTAVEHKSVLGPCERLAEIGFEVVVLPVTQGGVVDLATAQEMIDDNTLLVSVQGANSEIGTLQPVRQIAEMAHAHNVLMHCDATQMLGKVPFTVAELGVDAASFSAHKVYGPKGIGVLFVRSGYPRTRVTPVMFGGGHEGSLRPGTLNAPGIVGFGEACKIAQNSLAGDMEYIRGLRDTLELGLSTRIRGTCLNGDRAARVPGTTSISIDGVPADLLIARVPQVCMSAGSACTTGAVSPSHVLLACGRSRDQAACTVRLSVGRYNTQRDVQLSCDLLVGTVESLREESCRK
jgi:cysteine desulfurase